MPAPPRPLLLLSVSTLLHLLADRGASRCVAAGRVRGQESRDQLQRRDQAVREEQQWQAELTLRGSKQWQPELALRQGRRRGWATISYNAGGNPCEKGSAQWQRTLALCKMRGWATISCNAGGRPCEKEGLREEGGEAGARVSLLANASGNSAGEKASNVLQRPSCEKWEAKAEPDVDSYSVGIGASRCEKREAKLGPECLY
ncbi:unnamed protein product [Prorocentrum cordatum]|uniref:Subtilisin n=1 Tax=Prorocentrum cordatum TaxID=2364126 RepID=A0ABN9VUG2_9DINO|nr:unnamed protein product [Polarella glacialis]